jgi:hypothetical protein
MMPESLMDKKNVDDLYDLDKLTKEAFEKAIKDKVYLNHIEEL